MSGNLVPFPSGKTKYVLDTWPVMEWLKDRKHVRDYFDGLVGRAWKGDAVLYMSMVNLGEVYYSSAKEWGLAEADAVLARMQKLPIAYVTASDEEVLSAARLKAIHSISYADAFAASLAILHRCQLVTGDVDFQMLSTSDRLQLEWLGA